MVETCLPTEDNELMGNNDLDCDKRSDGVHMKNNLLKGRNLSQEGNTRDATASLLLSSKE